MDRAGSCRWPTASSSATKTVWNISQATRRSCGYRDEFRERSQDDPIHRWHVLHAPCDSARDGTPFKMTHKRKDDQGQSASHRSDASVHEDSCRCRFNPPGTNYYVSTIDGSRYALLAGPFATHSEACKWVDRVRDEACRVDPRAWFYAFGTTAMRPEYRKPGILNDRLDLDGGP